MLALHVVPWKELLAITAHGTRWSTWQRWLLCEWPDPFWLYRLVRQHDEYTLEGFSPNATVIVLVLVFYFATICLPACLRTPQPCCRLFWRR